MPFLIGMVFAPKVSLGFVLGAIFVGFFLATSTTLTAGLLESSKEAATSKKTIFLCLLWNSHSLQLIRNSMAIQTPLKTCVTNAS